MSGHQLKLEVYCVDEKPGASKACQYEYEELCEIAKTFSYEMRVGAYVTLKPVQISYEEFMKLDLNAKAPTVLQYGLDTGMPAERYRRESREQRERVEQWQRDIE